MQHKGSAVLGDARGASHLSVAGTSAVQGSGRNERLYALLVRSGESYNSLADKIGADPKTVQRWVSQGRVPRPSLAFATAKALGADATYVWPELGRRHQAGIARVDATEELLGYYPSMAELPNTLVASLLADARYGIDIQGDFGLADPRLADLLIDRAHEGVDVRIVLPNPALAASRVDASRAEALACMYTPLIGRAGIIVTRACCPVLSLMVRSDNEIIVRVPLDGCPAAAAPVMHARRVPGGPLVSAYRLGFECLYERAEPIQADPAPVRVVA